MNGQGHLSLATHDILARYGTAALLAIGTLALTRALAVPLAEAHFVFPLAAVFLSGLLGGIGPGLLAAALSVAGYFPVLSRDVHAYLAGGHYHPYRLLSFAVTALLAATTTGWLRSAYLKRGRALAVVTDQFDFLQAITENLLEGLFAFDAEGGLIFMNASGARMLGWSQEELIGKPVCPIVHARRPDGTVMPPEACPMLATLRTGHPHRDDEDYLTRKDGALLPVRTTSSPIWKSGRVTGVVVSFQDFSDHQFLAEASRLLEDSSDPDCMLKSVARMVASKLGNWCMVVLLDSGERPRVVTVETSDPDKADVARDLLETARNLGGPSVSSYKPDRYPIDLSAAHGMGRALRTGESELLNQVGNSTGAAVAREELLAGVEVESFMGVPMRARGRLVGAIGLAVAGSARRFDEQDLALSEELARRCALAVDNAELYQSAQEGERAREEALAVVSHDLRGPLTNILMASKTLEKLVEDLIPEGPLGDTVRSSSRVVIRCATRMNRLVNDLQDFASIEAGQLSVVRAPHAPESIAREGIEAFQPMAESSGVLLAEDFTPGGLAVECDRDRILQVLSNLLSNAIHAAPKGGAVTVTVAEDEGQAVFSVKDTGAGIPPDELPNIFDRYRRGRSSNYKGAGLGLAIARKIVEMHGGRIWAESTLGRGSAFRFRLPAVRLEARSDILVVDDDTDLRCALRNALEPEGYHITLAANGREAWEWLQSAPLPALIFLDLMMPVMDGFELLRLVRADTRLRSVPVVLATAFGSLAKPVAAKSQGFLAKPFEVEQVLELASRYCRPRVGTHSPGGGALTMD
jgi:PAS domain S-box-containing protein